MMPEINVWTTSSVEYIYALRRPERMKGCWERGSPEPLMGLWPPEEERLWRAALPADESVTPQLAALFLGVGDDDLGVLPILLRLRHLQDQDRRHPVVPVDAVGLREGHRRIGPALVGAAFQRLD